MYKQIVPFFMCFQTGPFHLVSSPLTTYNQQLWLTCVMQAENSKSKRPQIELSTVLCWGGDSFLF